MKNSILNDSHVGRDHDVCKATAAGKGQTSNARHGIRNCDARKTATVGKGRASNARHAVFDYDCLDIRAQVIPWSGLIAEEVRHYTRTGDGESTVVSERPCQVIAACAGRGRGKQGGFVLRGGFFCHSNQDDLERLLFGGLFHGEAALGSFIPLRRGEIGICTRREKIAAVLLRENELIHIALRRIDRERQLLRRADKAHAHGLRLRFLCGFSRRFGRGFLCRLGRRLRSRGDRRFLRGFRYRRFGRLRIGGRVSGVLAVDGPRGHGELHGHHDRQKCGKQFLHMSNSPFKKIVIPEYANFILYTVFK